MASGLQKRLQTKCCRQHPMEKKIISFHFEWRIDNCPSERTIFFNTSKCNLKFMVYHTAI